MVSIVGLVGCKDPVLVGHIVAKNYAPPGMAYIPVVLSCGNNCTTVTMFPDPIPASFDIYVDGTTVGGERRQEWVPVNEEYWNVAQVGDLYERK